MRTTLENTQSLSSSQATKKSGKASGKVKNWFSSKAKKTDQLRFV